MSESVKKVAGLVGIVALGFVTFGVGTLLFAGVAGGASFGAALGSAIGGGFAIGGAAVSFATLSAVGFVGLTVATTPSLEQTGAGSRSTPFADPNAVGSFVFGRTLLPMVVLYEEQHGNAPDRQITDVFAHCWHDIEGYVSLRIGGGNDGVELVSFSGESATGEFTDLLWWIRADGTQTQSLQDTHTVPQMNANAWPSDAIGAGVAHSAFIWNIDDDGFTAKFSGVPQRKEIEADCARLYDPREDPAYGSGSQDFADPSTWTFPTNGGNAVLVALRMLIGERTAGGELIWGRGAIESQINLENAGAMASVCDESLDSAYRFTLGGFWRLTGDWEGFVRRWEEETGGKIYKVGGIYHFWVPHDDLTPLTTITEADFLDGPSIEHTVASGIDDLYNTARGRYIEPTEGYNGFPYPEVSEASAVADDGGKRILNQDFSWIQSRSLAERIVRLRIRRSRYQRAWIVPLGWQGQGPNYAPFTVHTLNCRETGNTDQLVRVMYRDMSFEGGTLLVLQEENIEIYDDTVALGTAFNSDAIPARIDRLGTLTPRTLFRDVIGAGTLALKINSAIDLTTDEPGEAAIVGVAANGSPDPSTDGFVYWQGLKVAVPRQSPADSDYTILTNLASKLGFIAFDTSGGTPFTVSGQSCDVAFVFKDRSGAWYYDNNSTAVAFTPTLTIVALGWLQTSNADLIEAGGLFGQPVTLTLATGPAGEAGAEANRVGHGALNLNPMFRESDGSASVRYWTASGSVLGAVFLTDGVVGPTAMRISVNGGQEVWSEKIPVDPSENYLVSVYGRRTGGGRNSYLAVQFFDASDSSINGGGSGATGWLSLGSYFYWGIANGLIPSSFTKYALPIGADGATIPATATHCRIGGLLPYTTGTANETTIELQAYMLRRLAPSEEGADITGNNTADDVLTGGGRAVSETGADATANHPDDVVFRQSSAPSHQEGRVWIDTDTGEIFRSVSGVWVFIGSDDVLLLDNVDEDTFTVTGVDPGWFSPGAVSGDCDYAASGHLVTLRFPSAIVGASDGVGMNFSGVPTALRPAVQQSDVVWPLSDNNSAADYFGRVSVQTSGNLTFLLMQPSGTRVITSGFTASNNKGIGAGLRIHYSRA